MTSRKRVKLRRLKRLGLLAPTPPVPPTLPQGEHQVNHTEFDSFHGFDDEANAEIKPKPAPRPEPAPEPKPIKELDTISFKVFKMVHDKPGITRADVCAQAKELGIPYDRASAALYDHEHRKRIKSERNAYPMKFHATVTMEEAVSMMNTHGRRPSRSKAETSSLIATLYEVVRRHPWNTLRQLEKHLAEEFPEYEGRAISPALAKFKATKLVRTGTNERGKVTYFATRVKYPAKRNRHPVPNNMAKPELKATTVVTPDTLWPAPESSGVNIDAAHESRRIATRSNLSTMSAQDIADTLTMRQARELFDILKAYFKV